MKKLRVILSILFVILMVGSLVYTNIISPEDKNSPLATFAKLVMPIFLLFSFFLMYLKKREEKEGKAKTSTEYRELFNSIGNSDDYKK